MSGNPDIIKSNKLDKRLSGLKKPQGRTSSKRIDDILGEVNFSNSPIETANAKKFEDERKKEKESK